MFFSEWHVLVVDDEPDVRELSKLVMRDFEVDGVPVCIHTASSQEEAIDLLKNKFTDSMGASTLAVAFIDVVMEHDSAGLELCDAIRNEMNNSTTQLYIRTGQPGIAPEREVIDKYDINGYFTKVEATEDKLYTLVKSGVRQYMWMEFAVMMQMSLHLVISNAHQTPEHIANLVEQMMGAFAAQRSPEQSIVMTLWAEDDIFMSIQDTPEQARARRERMMQLDPQPMTPEGDMFAQSVETHEVIFHIAETPLNPQAYFVVETHMVPDNPFFWAGTAYNFRSVLAIWQAAKQRQLV